MDGPLKTDDFYDNRLRHFPHLPNSDKVPFGPHIDSDRNERTTPGIADSSVEGQAFYPFHSG